jgi:diguanylate cyclase (GGDEF)-like protein
VTGFIDLMSGKPNFFDPDVGPILQAFAVQAAVAMDNARLYEQSQQRMAETSALFRAVQPLFHPTNDIFAFSQQIAHSVTQEFASSHCSILLLNETRTHLSLAGQSGSLKLTTSDLDLNGPGLTVAAVRTGRTIYSPDVTTEKNYVAGAEQSRCELVIPLFASGAVIGVLNLESIQVDAFDERARRLLATFAERAALGLENARLFGTIRMNAEEMTRLSKIAERRAQEAETLRLAAASVNSTLDLQTVLDRILKHLDHVIPHESACIFLFEDENMMRAWAVKSVARSEEVLHQTFPRNDALLQQIEQTNRPMVLRDAQNDPRFKGWGGTSGVRSWMGIPLLAVNELIGTLTLDRYSSDEFLPEEIELAQAFANQAAVAVQNARLYDTAQQHSRELEALHSATSTLVSTLDLQKLLERILAAAARAVPMTEAALLHLVGEGNKLYLRVRQGVSAINEQCYNWNDDKSPWRWALEHGKPLLACSGSLPPGEECLFSCPPDWNDQSMMIVPLILDHQPMGLITLISSQGGQFTEQELTLLNSFANTATAAMHNAQLHSAVQHLAITDPLTGVFNRRGFYDYAGRVIEQAQILGRPIAAIMIDIDFFKRVNDNYGHDAGDIVLRELVDRCRTVLRDADLICRYGGEEFAILLTESDISGAMNAANRILYAITSDPMNTPAGPVSITVSVGIAEYNNTGDTLDRLLKCADLALFTAKKQGRNRVCVWEE